MITTERYSDHDFISKIMIMIDVMISYKIEDGA